MNKICEDFIKNPKINPITKDLFINNNIYNDFVNMCKQNISPQIKPIKQLPIPIKIKPQIIVKINPNFEPELIP